MASSNKSKSVKTTSKDPYKYENAFNKSLVGTIDGINVQPNILRVDPTRYCEEKLVFYITNLSDVPQHLNVLNLDFSKDTKPQILVYHSRVIHKDITEQYQEVYPIELVVESDEVFQKRFQSITPGPTPVVRPKSLAQKAPAIQHAKCVKDGLMQKFKNHNKPRPTVEWIFHCAEKQ